MATDNTTLALDLISLGFYVFPADPTTKAPLTEHGHLDATLDPELAATWFSFDYPQARVAIATGRSGVLVLDIDIRPDKNGLASLDGEWLDIPKTFSYGTPSGGTHHWYEEPIGNYRPQMDYRGMPGVDRKSGSSYVLVYGDAPKSRDEILRAPGWLLDESESRVGASFEGGLDAWLNSIPEGEPNSRVEKAVAEFPTVPFEHPAMVEAQYELVRLAAEGSPGVRQALEELRGRWLTPPWDTPDHEYEFDVALYGAAKKAGGEDQRTADLPTYGAALAELPDTFDTFLLNSEGTKAHWFRVARALAEVGAPEHVALSVLWNSPATKKFSREWRFDYCADQYQLARDKRPEVATVATPQPVVKAECLLLDESERELNAEYTTFVDRYLTYASLRTMRVNAPYHRQAAWDILSLAFAFHGFVPQSEGPMPVNLFSQSLGKSSTGKTRALKLRSNVLRDLFKEDPEYDLGSDASIQALHEDLLKRDRLASFFNADESAVFFGMLQDQKYMSVMSEFLTRLYEGFVPPQLRRGKKDGERTALTHFNVSFQGTPERVTSLLTKEMFYTGFLPRFVWFLGDEPVDSDDQYRISQADSKRAHEDHDPLARALASELRAVRKTLGLHNPVMGSEEALRRLERAAKDSKQFLRRSEHWDILEPSWKRMSQEAVVKIATLLALSEGSLRFELRHALKAIEQMEEWCVNLVWVSKEISASVFQRECNEIEAFIRSQGGEVPKSKLARRFSSYRTRDFLERLESLREQRRVVGEETLKVVE